MSDQQNYKMEMDLNIDHTIFNSNFISFSNSNVLTDIFQFSLQEVIYEEDNLYLIFEYCDYDLKKYMRSIGGPLPLETVKKFTY